MKGRLLIALSALCSSGLVAAFSDRPATLKAGPWTVYRSTDKMTDAVVCTGIYKTNMNVQLNERELLIAIDGGVRAVVLRFGQEPPQQMRLGTQMEKDARVVVISRPEVEKAVTAGRLRVQVLTALNDSHVEDIDMTGAKQAREHMEAKCPLPAAGAPRAAQTTSSGCSATAKERLAAAGMRPAQIAAICDTPPR